jgi:methyl-accepting chemotaxis protein
MNKRKDFLINPKFQINMIGKITLLALVNNLIFITAVRYFFKDLQQTALKIGLPQNHIFFTFLETQYTDMFLLIIVASIVSFLLIVIFGLMISHKIAGPLYRLAHDLNAMAAGEEIREVIFRKGDYFQELKVSFNEFIHKRKVIEKPEFKNRIDYPVDNTHD